MKIHMASTFYKRLEIKIYFYNKKVGLSWDKYLMDLKLDSKGKINKWDLNTLIKPRTGKGTTQHLPIIIEGIKISTLQDKGGKSYHQ